MTHIILQYLDGLEKGDAGAILELFSFDAQVHSPLYGDVPAKHFFNQLFTDTAQSVISLLNIFRCIDNGLCYTAHFKYTWTLTNALETSFECMDIFQFDGHGKITKLTIIYDTANIRGKLP